MGNIVVNDYDGVFDRRNYSSCLMVFIGLDAKNFSMDSELTSEQEDEAKKQKLINKKKLLSTLVCKRRKTLMNKTREMHEISGAECLLVIASKTGSVYHYSSPGFKPVVESDLLKEKFRILFLTIIISLLPNL